MLILIVSPAFHIFDLASLATVVVTEGGTPHRHSPTIFNTTYQWGRAYSEGIDFGRRDQKDSGGILTALCKGTGNNGEVSITFPQQRSSHLTFW